MVTSDSSIDFISLARLKACFNKAQISILNVSSMFSLIDTNSTKIKVIAQTLVNIKSKPKAFLTNSFNRKLSIKNKKIIHISYKAIFEITFDNCRERIDFHPLRWTDLKIPVKVSRTIADPTAINSPTIGTNNNIKDAKI